MYDWQDLDWTTRITVNAGAETLYTYTLTSACTGAADDCDVSGQDVRMRWITDSSSDTVQSVLTLDQEIVQRTDNDPTISNRAIAPATGTSLTTFDFSATYTDVVTCPPTLFDVSFNSGGAWTALTQSNAGDTNCADGKDYNLVPDQAGFCPNPAATYRFRVSDGVNPTVTDGSDLTFTVTNIAPSVTPDLAAESTNEGVAYVQGFAHNDNDITIACQSATWTVPVGPAECSITSPAGVLTCTGALAAGVYAITVRVNDGTTTADESFTLTVVSAGGGLPFDCDGDGVGDSDVPCVGHGDFRAITIECEVVRNRLRCEATERMDLNFIAGRIWVVNGEVVAEGAHVERVLDWDTGVWELRPAFVRYDVTYYVVTPAGNRITARDDALLDTSWLWALYLILLIALLGAAVARHRPAPKKSEPPRKE